MKNIYKISILILSIFYFSTVSAQIIRKPVIKTATKPVFRVATMSKIEQNTTKKVTQVRKLDRLDNRKFSQIKKVTPIYRPQGTGTTERRGVDLENVAEDIEFYLDEPISNKINIYRYIFPDKNTKSNFYYYLPSTYTLKWDKRNAKYAFNIFYLSSEVGEKGAVLIKMELVSNITKKDIMMAEKFLSVKLHKKVKLMPMPVQGISADFGSSLTNFNVKEESVQVNATSDYMKPIVVDWKMESNVDDFVSAMLNNIGINANMEYLLPGDLDLVTSVPIDLQVNDPVTFGKLEIENLSETFQNGWENYLDYPVILSKLVLLRQNTGGYYSTDVLELNTTQILPGEKSYDFSNILYQGNVKRAWFEYAIPECSECNEKVRKKIVGGTSGSQITNLEIQIMDIMTSSEAYMFKLNIKSKQADPNGVREVELPSITIKEDDMSIAGGKYYVPENDNLSYKYQLIQIMQDGTIIKSQWKRGDQSFLVIGTKQLETIFENNIEDSEEFNVVKDSLIDKGKDLLENLFKKKDKDKDKQD